MKRLVVEVPTDPAGRLWFRIVSPFSVNVWLVNATSLSSFVKAVGRSAPDE